MQTWSQKIEAAEDAFRSYGYRVFAEPIPGQEEVFALSLWSGVRKVEETMAGISKTFKTRGKSSRAMSILHGGLPVPAWGVEVAR